MRTTKQIIDDIDIREFLESQDITKSYQMVRDKNWNEVAIESLLIAFKEYINHDNSNNTNTPTS